MKSVPRLIYFIVFIFIPFLNYSQTANRKIDSLEQVLLQVNLPDSARLSATYDLAYAYLYISAEKSFGYSEKAFALAKKLGNGKLMGESLSLQGVYFKNKGDYPAAIEKHLAALELKEKIKDTLGSAIAYNDIGILYKQMNSLPKALVCYRKSNRLLVELNMLKGVSLTYGNIGTIFSGMNQLDSARFYYQKALTIAEQIGNKNALTTACSNIGEVYGKLHQPEKALDYFQKSLQIDIENQDNYGMILSYTNVGNALVELGKNAEAIVDFDKAEKLCSDNDARPLLKDVYKAKAEAYKKMNSTSLAYDYLLKYGELKDSILDNDMARQITELDTKYQSAKKDKDLATKDAELKVQQADAAKNAWQRNAFLIGFLLIGIFSFFIFRQYRQKKNANVEITRQKDVIEEKNKSIMDSIHYAKRIQRALLASKKTLSGNLSDHFVLYKPKDIVSGDFYWAQNINTNFLICTADCTGHGVPGAFMSLLGISYLNEITRERHINNPAQVLDKLREEVMHNLSADELKNDEERVNDGMDMILCNFKFNENKLDFACANNPLWLIRNGQLVEFAPDKMPIGNYHGEIKPFTLHSLDLQKGDLIYTITDGYADQFGGPKGKKFKYKALQQLLLSISDQSMKDQQRILDEKISEWQGALEQVDDMLIIGIRV